MSKAMHELIRLSREADESEYDSLAQLRSIGRDLERNIREVLRVRDPCLAELRALRFALQAHDEKMARASQVLANATALTALHDKAAAILWSFAGGALFVIALGMLN